MKGMLHNPTIYNSINEILNCQPKNINYKDIKKETEKAYYIGLFKKNKEVFYCWIPKSKSILLKHHKVIQIPEWLFDKKGEEIQNSGGVK